MSQILSEWLNRDVKLSIHVKASDLDQSFRSGYLFGELLNRFSLQKDFDTFSSSRSTDAWIANYIKLEPTLRHLGIPFHATIVRDLMQGKPGTAAKLLYQLRISLPKIKTLMQAKEETATGVSRGNQSYPSTPKSTNSALQPVY